ncbi:MAG: FixH family protein [Anaerolineales bacterium]|nr:FixH family protein [Anaerolineales bacterium]
MALSARRLQPRASFILLVMFLLILTGCRRAGQNDLADIGVNVAVNPNPPQVGQAAVTVTLSEADGQPITGAKVELEGNMTHAGMAPTLAQPSEVSPGRYEAPLDFTMAGDWFILVRATLPDGRKLERQVDVPGVKGQ